MKIAILSDLHSNYFALREVLSAAREEKINSIILLGDMFGYYPWSSETFHLLNSWAILLAIKGNHDLIVLENDSEAQSKHLAYYMQARYNHEDLKRNCPEALTWLAGLGLQATIAIDDVKINICHGTPSDTANGRFYPDDIKVYDWFPKAGELLLMGHSHYPLLRSVPSAGIIFNPGSVGQPRDGNPAASWGILSLDDLKFELRRTPYDHAYTCKLLRDMNWDKRSIAALEKNYSGNLKF